MDSTHHWVKLYMEESNNFLPSYIQGHAFSFTATMIIGRAGTKKVREIIEA